MLGLLYWIISTAAQIYIFIIFLQVLMSWLIALEMVNEDNEGRRNKDEEKKEDEG